MANKYAELLGDSWDVQLFRKEKGSRQHVLGWPSEVCDEVERFMDSKAYSSHVDMNTKLAAIYTANGHKLGLSPDYKYQVTNELIELMKRRGWPKEVIEKAHLKIGATVKGYFAGGGGFVMVTEVGENGGYLSAIPFDIAKRMIVNK